MWPVVGVLHTPLPRRVWINRVLHRSPDVAPSALGAGHARHMTVVIKAAEPADLLAMVPTLAGFEARNSLLLLMFRGKRTCGAVRFDLPSSSSQVVAKRLATHIVGIVCKVPGVDGVVPIVYTDEQILAGSALPRDDYVRVVERRLHYSGIVVREMLCVAQNGWASYFEPDRPASGHPLSEISESAVLRDAPEGLGEIQPLGGDLPEVSAEDREWFGTRLRAVRELLDTVQVDEDIADDELPEELTPLLDLPQLFEDAIGWDDREIRRWGPLLMMVLQGPPARDSAMLQWATSRAIGRVSLDLKPPSRAPDGSELHDDTPIGRLIGNLMFGVGPRPDPARIDSGIALVRRLTPLLDERQQLAPLCMLTWLSWALGHGSAAGDYLDRARRIDPKYGMVEVLGAMIDSGMMPEWAFHDPNYERSQASGSQASGSPTSPSHPSRSHVGGGSMGR